LRMLTKIQQRLFTKITKIHSHNTTNIFVWACTHENGGVSSPRGVTHPNISCFTDYLMTLSDSRSRRFRFNASANPPSDTTLTQPSHTPILTTYINNIRSTLSEGLLPSLSWFVKWTLFKTL
jgi:hypothetical protein